MYGTYHVRMVRMVRTVRVRYEILYHTCIYGHTICIWLGIATIATPLLSSYAS